jgi:hypothetical protein
VSNVRLELEAIKRDKLFGEIFDYLPPTSTIAIIGRMRSGKTTFAKLFASYIKEYYERQGDTVSYTIYSPELLEDLELLEFEIHCLSKDVNVLVFDDLSFIMQGQNRLVKNFLNLITRIAHITGSDFNYIFFIGHYSRAISPFLRASNCVVLTSISHPEISSLKELFTLSSLYDYLYYYEIYPKRYIYLIKYHVFERIIDFTLEDMPKPKKKREKDLWSEF